MPVRGIRLSACSNAQARDHDNQESQERFHNVMSVSSVIRLSLIQSGHECSDPIKIGSEARQGYLGQMLGEVESDSKSAFEMLNILRIGIELHRACGRRIA